MVADCTALARNSYVVGKRKEAMHEHFLHDISCQTLSLELGSYIAIDTKPYTFKKSLNSISYVDE